ncbi:MAG: hemolysin family protein [Angelakisella sp.]
MDPDTGSIISSFVFLLLSGLVVFCQNAIVDIPDNFLKKAEATTQNLKTLEKLLRSPRRFSSAMRVGYTFFQLCFAFFFGKYIISLPFLTQMGTRSEWWNVLAAFIVILCTTLLILICSRGIPKRLATWAPVETAISIAPVAWIISIVFEPLRFVVDLSVGGIASLFGAQWQEGEDNVTEEEIRMLVDVSEETGGIGQTEKEMINNIFEFDDRTASDLMTHRTDLIFIEKDCSLETIIELSCRNGYSRIPVADDNIDDLIGILNVKDLLPLILDSQKRRSFQVANYMRKPLFVPESTRCRDLFGRLNGEKTQIAVVVDEYGGTSGIVTMEDLLESIVGNIQDEYDNEMEEATALTDHSYTFDGDIDLSDVAHFMDCNLDSYTEEDYETLGGLIIGLLDRIPSPGEHPSVVIEDIEFTVEEASERQILRVMAKRLGSGDLKSQE